MVSKNVLINIAMVVSIIAIIVIFATVKIDFSKSEEKVLFPGIVGDSILKNNEIGIYFIRNITLYDDFRGDILQGYKATYSGGNGTMIIFIAQMKDNIMANRSLKDMVKRIGYNESISIDDSFNNTDNNWTILKLRVDNPEVFIVHKDKRLMWHYTFSKLDKVYWVGFSSEDVDYQLDMLVEVYRLVDKVKGSFDEI